MGDVLSRTEMLSYLVMSAGVDGSIEGHGRVCTHGAQSIHARAGISYDAAQKAMRCLFATRLLERPSAELLARAPRASAVLPALDPLSGLAISQEILAKARSPEVWDTGTLGALENMVKPHPLIPVELVVRDALAVYIGLHRHLSFEAFGGVDPRMVSSPCAAAETAAMSELPPIYPFDPIPGWALISQVPQPVTASAEFVAECMSYLPQVEGCEATQSERVEHAIAELLRLGFAYPALVLWSGDPRGRRGALPPKVIATHYVGGLRDARLEQRLQDHVHELAFATEQLERTDMFKGRRCSSINKSGVYRYLVSQKEAGKVCLMHQLRPRRWAYNKVNLEGLVLDARRIELEVRKLKQLSGLIDSTDAGGMPSPNDSF